MLTLRPTTADDLDRVVAIEAATDTTEWLCDTGRSWHERALADPDQEHLVAEDDGAVRGEGRRRHRTRRHDQRPARHAT